MERAAVSGRPGGLVVPLSFGDLVQAADALRWAIKKRNLSLLTTTLWVIRENQRCGTWQPFTFGRYIVLRRMRVFMATEPYLRDRRPWWRHTEDVSEWNDPTSRPGGS